MEEGETKTSKFSGALAQIYRLDELWKKVNNAATSNNFTLWNTILDRIWCELARDLQEDEYEKKEETFKDFDNEIANNGGFNDEEPGGFKHVSKDLVQKRSDLYYILMKKDLFLRRLENHLGKGTSYDDGDEDDFD